MQHTFYILYRIPSICISGQSSENILCFCSFILVYSWYLTCTREDCKADKDEWKTWQTPYQVHILVFCLQEKVMICWKYILLAISLCNMQKPKGAKLGKSQSCFILSSMAHGTPLTGRHQLAGAAERSGKKPNQSFPFYFPSQSTLGFPECAFSPSVKQ